MGLPIARVIAALPDPQLRLRRLAEYLRETDAHEATLALHEAATGTRDGVLRELHLAFLHLVLHVKPRPTLPGGPLPLPDRAWLLGDLKVAGLVGAAIRQGLDFTHRLLRDAFTPPQPEDAVMLQVHPTLEDIPLGVRKERARGAHRERLAALLVDTTPSVVQILAENPRVLEPAAVQIASLRPQHPYALQALLMAPRWLSNVAVGEAAARNQAAPGWLVLGLAPLLPRKAQYSLAHMLWLDGGARAVLRRFVGLDDDVPLPAEPVTAATVQRDDQKVWLVDEVPGYEWDVGEKL
jgi:hypothetical protein